LPLSLISSNASKIFFQDAYDEKCKKGGYRKSLLSFTYLLIGGSIPMVIVMMLFAPWIFEILFGMPWRVAGEFVVILAPMYGIRFVVSALTPALVISNKQNIDLFLSLGFIFWSLLSYFICKASNQTISTFLVFISITYSINYLLFYTVIFKLSKNN
jgi:O-antigen/teichoic acid export membrane protein